MQLFFKTHHTGTTLTLDVKKSDNISSLKELIQDRAGVPVNRQRLMWNGKLLENENTLSSYQIEDGCFLQLLPTLQDRHVDLYVKIDRQEIFIEKFSLGYTVLKLKEKIEALTDISASVQILRRHGEEMANELLLSSCPLENGCLIELYRTDHLRWGVWVNVEEKKIFIDDNEIDHGNFDYSVSTIKEEIAARTGIDAKCLTLKHSEMDLEDNQRFINCNFLENRHAIQAEIEELNFIFRNTTGEGCWIKVRQGDTIHRVKAEIEKVMSVPLAPRHYLYYKNSPLKYESGSVSAYKLPDLALLYFEVSIEDIIEGTGVVQDVAFLIRQYTRFDDQELANCRETFLEDREARHLLERKKSGFMRPAFDSLSSLYTKLYMHAFLDLEPDDIKPPELNLPNLPDDDHDGGFWFPALAGFLPPVAPAFPFPPVSRRSSQICKADKSAKNFQETRFNRKKRQEKPQKISQIRYQRKAGKEIRRRGGRAGGGQGR